ncbi:MAG: GYD domain-containing protein, partial [Gammaproteobacteria bacterium]|nr:GYD domain-containing protein [Gammaproteobacteria bacterium]
MRRYMIQIKYNISSVQGLVGNPQDRKPQAARIMEKLGGSLIDFYFTFGEWDAVILVELPDDAHAMAVAMA